MPAYTERAPGNYPSTFVKLDTEYPIVVRETGEEAIRWRWVFQDVNDPTTMGEMDTITTPGFKARSNGLKLFTGMLGRAPREGDDTDALIGQVFDVQYGPNQNGRNTVVGALKRTPTAPQNVTDLKPETATFRDVSVPVTDPRVVTPTTTPEGDGGTEDDQLPF